MFLMRTKLAVILVVSGTLILSLFGLFNYFKTHDRLYGELEYEVSSIAQRLSFRLPDQIWNYDFDTVVNDLESEATSRFVYRIEVIAREDNFRHITAPKDGLTDNEFHLRIFPIVYDASIRLSKWVNSSSTKTPEPLPTRSLQKSYLG
ncbi:hypothetical protein [Enterovibrio coralii]|uniref:hypothetical protein n=1 Tax=Enterovibrio coralii TaxID=294935 RepID=UPI000A7D960E|nr:hypothetical protein [Enterovibrio coralii]